MTVNLKNYIFISYSRVDTNYVDDIVGRLQTEGYDVWIDRGDIVGGGLWRSQIVEAIEKSFAMLVILSGNSVQSDNVRAELDLAKDEKIPIIPVVIGEVSVPSGFKYQLAGIQRVRFGTNEDDNFRLLTVALKSIRPVEKAEVTEGASEYDIALNWDGQTSMRGFNLAGHDLSDVFLQRADLRDANLRDANLSKAKLAGADLRGANLRKANLREAKLRWAELCKAKLAKADLRETDLRNAGLSEADLRETNLRGAKLCKTHRSGANLSWAELSGAYLEGANLQGADLRDTDLGGVYLSEVKYDDKTQWPTGFNPEEAGAVKV